MPHSQFLMLLNFADTGYEPYGLVEKKTESAIEKITGWMNAHGASKIVIACNSASAVYRDTYEVRGIVPFGVSSVLKNNVPQKALITGNSIVRS